MADVSSLLDDHLDRKRQQSVTTNRNRMT